jgi:hypothetical protein
MNNKNKYKINSDMHPFIRDIHKSMWNPPGSADRVFLDACRVFLSQQYHRVQHNLCPLKRNENKKRIKCKEPFPKSLDIFP